MADTPPDVSDPPSLALVDLGAPEPLEVSLQESNLVQDFSSEVPAPVEESPLLEMLGEPEAVAAEAPPPSDPTPETVPLESPVQAQVKPSPSSVRRVPAKNFVSEDADDPLAGLAESLGGSSGDRIEPPPPVVETATVAPPPATAGTSVAVKVARLAVVAAVLSGLAWLGHKKYAESVVIPVIETYLPNPAEPGQTVTINGTGFGTDPDPTVVQVMLGQVEAQVLDASPTRINILIPESLGAIGSHALPLKVRAQDTVSTGQILKILALPKVASLTPRVALTGDEVAIAGRWLGNPKSKPTVTVAGNEAEILEATPSRLRIRIPEVAATEGQTVSLKVSVGSDVSKEKALLFGRLPFIESVAPERALPGEIVTVTGVGLMGPDLSVMVASKAAIILSSSDSEIKVSLPGLRLSESAGRRDLTVLANEKTSLIQPIEILRESAGLYGPRFFPESLASGRVAVSCELGPVMVFGDDLQSKKRAHDAAAKLNTLVSEGRTNRILFEASDSVIRTPGGPVLTVGPGDGGGNPRVLAGLWAAHLSDMFDLFLQGRRPGRTVELSPDGKVFLEIFSASRRRSAEPGVPPAVLFSPDPAWLRSLGSLAEAPVLGSGHATALLDGYWAGTIEGPAAASPRKIEISLTVTPTGLIGQKTSRQGRLSSDVTLENLNYARRELRFSFVDSGEALTYTGRLDGDAIEGNVAKASGAKVGKLTFKLTR